MRKELCFMSKVAPNGSSKSLPNNNVKRSLFTTEKVIRYARPARTAGQVARIVLSRLPPLPKRYLSFSSVYVTYSSSPWLAKILR